MTCLPCAHPIEIADEPARTSTSVLERAREAARRLKGSKAPLEAGGARETFDSRRGNSLTTPDAQQSEKPFGSALKKAQLKAAEIRASVDDHHGDYF